MAKKKTTKKAAPKTKPKKVAKVVKVVAKAAKLSTKAVSSGAAKTLKAKAPSAPPLEHTVDGYLTKVAPWQRVVIEKLRMIVKSTAPHVSEVYKWGQPVYEHKGPFAYVKAHAAQVNFGFWRGADLDDPKRMLQGEGERMRHVKILETHVIDDAVFGAFVKQAVTLNDKKGDPTKG
jgi:hypothetical protein